MIHYIKGHLGKIYIMGEGLFQAKFNNSATLTPFHTKDLPYWLNEIEAHSSSNNDIVCSSFASGEAQEQD